MANRYRKIIAERINRMRTGYIFTSSDFYDIVDDPVQVSRILRQLVQEGKIRKVSKGRFDRPKQTMFGALAPSEDWMLQDAKNGHFDNLSIDRIATDLKNKSKTILADNAKSFEKSDFEGFRRIFELIKEIQNL